MNQDVNGSISEPKSGKGNLWGLRHTFVSMLFALAIAEIAIQSSNLVSIATSDWRGSEIFAGVAGAIRAKNWQLTAPAAHLVLAFALITTSWVGWSNSINKKPRADVSTIFSFEFLLLVIELGLLVLYFILVRSVEISVGIPASIPSDATALATPSAAPEAFWLLAIYLGYAIWDAVADGRPSFLPREHWPVRSYPAISWICVVLSGVFIRSCVSIFCAMLTFFVWKLSVNVQQQPTLVVVGDVALLSIVFLFRLAKRWEPNLVSTFVPYEQYREGSRNVGKHSWETTFIVIFLALFVLTTILLFIGQSN